MDMQQLEERMQKILKDGDLKDLQQGRGAVVGHNSHALAGSLVLGWIHLLQEWFDQIYYIELSTPSICQYAMQEFSVEYGFWLHVTTYGTKVICCVEICTNDGRRQRHVLFENGEWDERLQFDSMENVPYDSSSRFFHIRYQHEPNFIKQYLQSLISKQIPVYRIQRERFRVVAGFQDSCHSRFIVHYLNSLGCKVIPLLHEFVSGSELAHTVTTHQAVCGLLFDDCLNLQTFCTEQGGVLDSKPDMGVNDVLLQHVINGCLQHKHIESLLQHSSAVDGVWIVTRLLEWMAVTNACPSELLTTNGSGSEFQQGNGGDLRTCQGT